MPVATMPFLGTSDTTSKSYRLSTKSNLDDRFSFVSRCSELEQLDVDGLHQPPLQVNAETNKNGCPLCDVNRLKSITPGIYFIGPMGHMEFGYVPDLI